MSKAHVICTLLPLLFVAGEAQGDTRLFDMCRRLAMRVEKEIHDDTLLVERLGLGWIVGGIVPAATVAD